ncbi:MAG: hypothetical protein ACRDP6_11185 [Actinoallomurus sp.]
MTDFDGWADLSAQRSAEDDVLVQRYAAGEGRGQDMRPVRGFVRHVRHDIGPKGLILKVRMTENAPRREICVWYRIPPDGERPGRTRTASVTEASPAEDGATGEVLGGDLAALGRASAVPPAVSPAPSITETTTATSSG